MSELFRLAREADAKAGSHGSIVKPPLSLRRPIPHLHGSWRGIGFHESGGPYRQSAR